MPEDLKPRPFSRKWITVMAVAIFLAIGTGISFLIYPIRNSPFDAVAIGWGLFSTGFFLLVQWYIRFRSKDD